MCSGYFKFSCGMVMVVVVVADASPYVSYPMISYLFREVYIYLYLQREIYRSIWKMVQWRMLS